MSTTTSSVNGFPMDVVEVSPEILNYFGNDEILAIRYALRHRAESLYDTPMAEDYRKFLEAIMAKLATLQPYDEV